MQDRYSSSRSGAAVLDRPQPSTATEPVLQPVSAEMAVAGGTEDSSITVIENRDLTELNGLLVSRSFFENRSGRGLTGVLHLRVDRNFVVKQQEEYSLVTLMHTRDQGDLYAAMGSEGQILPSLSRRPFIICFISSKKTPGLGPEVSTPREDYERWYRELSKRGDRTEVIKGLYKFLVERKYPDFRLDDAGNLALPWDYAMVERVHGLGLFIR